MISGNPMVTEVPDRNSYCIYCNADNKSNDIPEIQSTSVSLTMEPEYATKLKKKNPPGQIGQHTPGFLTGFTQDIEHTCCVHTFWPKLH